MGDGYSPFSFDFGLGPSPEEDEEERRRRETMFAPALSPEVDQLLAPEPEPETIMAPNVVGARDPISSGILDEQQEWLSRRPERPDPSTGRKILGGVAGFLAGMGGGGAAGAAVNRRIQYGDYNQDVADWKEEGVALSDVGNYAEKVGEEERLRSGDVMDYKTGQDRVSTAYSAIEQRAEAENQRHQDRKAAAKTDAENSTETIRHNKEQEKLAGERDATNKRFAGTSETRAATGTAREKRLSEAGPQGQDLGSYPQGQQAFRDALMEMMLESPMEMAQFWDKTGNILDPPEATGALWWLEEPQGLNPAEFSEYESFKEEAEKRALERLRMTKNDLGDVDVYSKGGRRQEIP